jgi:crotonobetainyl-CoA:carnitine CoA-transferase CaiB-like acyl-CoA transferase
MANARREKKSGSQAAPLAGVRVLSLGGIWAGRVASMLLADQGADVVEVNRPDNSADWSRALLSRGKKETIIDLKTEQGKTLAQKIAAEADIVIENLGPGRSEGFGLDYQNIRAHNSSVVYVSIPGFAANSSSGHVAGWEGTIAASVGVYTDIHAQGPVMGGRPRFTALPMASAYGGVHAAIAASSAFYQKLKTGIGSFVEVPLADATLSSMALLIMEIEGQPAYFDVPAVDKVMTSVAMPILRDIEGHLTDEHRKVIRGYLSTFAQPMFANHLCADGRHIYLNATGHVHQARACLEVLGILDDMIAEGMVVATPYAVDLDNNISDASGLSAHWKERLRVRTAERLLSRPASEWEALFQQAGVPASVVRTADEWLNWPVSLSAGTVSEIDDPEFGGVRQAGRFISLEGATTRSPALRSREEWEGHWPEREKRKEKALLPNGGGMLEGIRVLDLSNVIAGPVGARTLAELGADVIRVDPVFPQAGPRMTLWFGVDVNQGKRSIILDLKTEKGREVLTRLVRKADVVIHNYLDRSLAGIGISPEQLRAINPDIISCQISAWGGPEGGALKDFPAYDPVLQAATGITARYGTKEAPVMHGMASCVDYITGFSAALGVLQALVSKELGRDVVNVRTSLAMGAQLVQFPFMAQGTRGQPLNIPSGQETPGYGAHYRFYKTRDGWAFLACRPDDVSKLMTAMGCTDAAGRDPDAVVAQLALSEIRSRLAAIPNASIVPVTRLDELRRDIAIAEELQPAFSPERSGLLMVNAPHPSGHRISLPFPSWYRSARHPIRRLAPAAKPGANTLSVLEELAFSGSDVSDLLASRVIAEEWTVLKGYFP